MNLVNPVNPVNPVMLELKIAKRCPYCGRTSYETVITKSIRSFYCEHCGYCEFLGQIVKAYNVELDRGRYKYYCSETPYGLAEIYYKNRYSTFISISKANSDSFIESVIKASSELDNVILHCFKNGEFLKINLLEYL